MTRKIIAALDDIASQLEQQGLTEAAILLDTAANTLEQSDAREAAISIASQSFEDGTVLKDILDKVVDILEDVGGIDVEKGSLKDLIYESLIDKDFLKKKAGKTVTVREIINEEKFANGLEKKLGKGYEVITKASEQ